MKCTYFKPMTKTTVTAIFNNTKYRGQYKYRDVVIEGGVPRIVSDELFQKVQDRLAKNKISRSHFKANRHKTIIMKNDKGFRLAMKG